MTREEYIEFANALKNNYTIDFDKLGEFCDMAIVALPEEGAELIDRRQIKWYGCNHEGRIKEINCETADCSKCFYATVEHDEVMSLPVYRIPGSADIEKIRAEIAEIEDGISSYHNDRPWIYKDEALAVIDKHINTETWNGYHGTTTAPKGTFDRIYEECKDSENDEI